MEGFFFVSESWALGGFKVFGLRLGQALASGISGSGRVSSFSRRHVGFRV